MDWGRDDLDWERQDMDWGRIWIRGRIWIGEGYGLGKAGYGLGKRKDMDLERGSI